MFNEHRLWERAQEGEFQYRIEGKRKKNPLLDWHQNECWWTDLLFITDSRFDVGDVRHDVVREANRHKTDSGVICGSGKWDAGKAYVQIDGKVYGKFKTKGGRPAHCALCEGGDLIPPEQRYQDSEYRPELPPG